MLEQCSTDSDRQRTETDEIYSVAIGFAASFCVATFCAFFVFHSELIHDPPGVVGQPVIDGYSERSEQLAWFFFWSAPFLVSMAVSVGLRYASVQFTRRAGLAILLATPAVTAVSDHMNHELWVLVTVVVTAATVGLWLSRSEVARTHQQWELGLWGMVLLCLMDRHYGYLWSIFQVPEVLAAALIGLLAFGYALYRRRRWREALARCWQAIRLSEWTSAVLLLTSMLMLTTAELTVFPLIALVWCAVRSGTKCQAVNGFMVSIKWLCIVLCVIVTATWANWNFTYQFGPGSVLLLFILAAATTVMLFRREQWLEKRADSVNSLLLSRKPLTLIVAAGTAIPLVLLSWWTALVTGIIVLAGRFRRSPPQFAQALFAAVGLLVAFVCRLSLQKSNVDPFHDGQILSAVWEFESGRMLYSEVFPLRSFEFFVAWLGRMFLPQTFEAYRGFYDLFRFLPLAGGLLFGFVWTRSLIWGLAVGLAIGTQPMFARQGALLILAAVTLEILRSDHRRHWLLLGIPGFLCCLYGFDAIGSVGVAAIGSVFLSAEWRNPGVASVLKFMAVRGLRDTFIVLLSFVLPFSLLLAVFIEPQALANYWALFADNARHLNAFYGIPVSIDALVNYRGVMVMFVLLVLWNAVYGSVHSRMSESKRRKWVFVSLFVLLASLRAVGRSDVGHFDCVIYPAVLLAVLSLFEFTCLVRHLGLRNTFTNRSVVAGAISVIAAWNIPHIAGNPFLLYSQYQSLSAMEMTDLGVDRYVQDTLEEDAWLWPVENGISNYANQRHNPTRHAIAFTISSPREQRNTVVSLKENPPQLIEWPSAGGSSITPLRYYIISQYLYRAYRPAQKGGFLVPNIDSGQDPEIMPHVSHMKIDMGHLPWAWGERRLAQIDHAVEVSQSVLTEKVVGLSGSEMPVSWNIELPPEVRQFNYLVLRIAYRETHSQLSVWSRMTVHLLPGDSASEDTAVATFMVRPDGRQHEYMIPIGCSPDWSWQANGCRLMIGSESSNVDVSHSRLLSIDEMRSSSF